MISRRWNRQSITIKFSLVFGLLLMFIVLIGILTLVVLNNVRQRTETAILSAAQIQQLVLEMDEKLEKARRLQRDFFWRYPEIGFTQARTVYADQALEQIRQVVILSSRLKELISASDASSAFKKSNIDINLYLYASERYGNTFQEAVDLTSQLALEGKGWQDQLAANSRYLNTLLENTRQVSWMDDYQTLQLNEKDYYISEHRSSMQAAMNILLGLRRSIEAYTALDPDLRNNLLSTLESHNMLIDKVVQTDSAIRSKLNDFDYQAQSIDPISQEWIALANDEIKNSHQQIEQTSLNAMFSLALLAILGLGLTSLVALLLNRSITANIVHLTRAAAEFQAGNFNIQAKINSEDELGKLANTMNSMAIQLRESFTSLQFSEARYRDLFEESPIALWEEDFSAIKRYIDQLAKDGVKDLQGYLHSHPETLKVLVNMVAIIDVNRAAVDLLKYERKEDLLQDLSHLFTDSSYDTFGEEMIALANGVPDFEGEISHRTAQNSLVQLVLRMNIVPGFEQTWSKVLVSLTDVTEQRAAAFALEESERRFRIIFNSVNDAIFVHNISTGAILDVNETASEIYGHTREEILQHDVGFLSAAEDNFTQEAALEWMNKAETQGPQIFEWKCRHKDGHLFWTEVNMRVAVINNQERLLVVSRDINERKRAEEVYRNLNTELEKRVADRTAQLSAVNKELEAFSYSISHDLRAPLRAMDGFSQALLEDYLPQLDPQAQHFLQRIRSNNLHMSRLIDALLNLSRITRSALAVCQVDLAEMAREIFKELSASEPGREVQFIAPSSIIAQADPVLLRVVLGNLLGNAFKFTSHHPVAHIEFGAYEENGQQVYYIKDDGAGFDMAYQNKLFGTFQRLHPATEFEGTGIGLALVQRVIHHHGGQIWAQGAVEQGATFFFTLAGSKWAENF